MNCLYTLTKSENVKRLVTSYEFFVTQYWMEVTIPLMMICCFLAIVPVVLIEDSPIREVQDNLWNPFYNQYLVTSLWVALPLAIDTALDLYKENFIGEISTCVVSRSLLVFSVLAPQIILVLLPYNSQRQFSWDFQASVLLCQNICIISGLFMIMFRKGAIKSSIAAGEFNVVVNAIQLFLLLVLDLVIYDFHCLQPEMESLFVLLVVCSVMLLAYFCYIVVRQILLLTAEKVDGRFQNHFTMNDFLNCLILLFFLGSTVILLILENNRHPNQTPMVTLMRVLASSEKLIILILVITFLTLIPIRVAEFHANLEGDKLLGKLNTIRYVSHEMRTPLNTVYLSVQYAQDLLQELQNQSEIELKRLEALVYSSAAAESPCKLTSMSSEEEEMKNKGNLVGDPVIRRSIVELPPLHQNVNSTAEERLGNLQETVGHIKIGCDVVLATLNDLLTADKLEDDKLTLDRTSLNPWEFIQEVANSFVLLAKEKKVQFVVECKDKESEWFNNLELLADHFKLSQVIRNFISNALKFTPTDGVVTVKIEKVRRKPRRENRSTKIHDEINVNDNSELPNIFDLRLSVKDSGAGISEENQKKLFGQYVQFNAAKLQQGKGSGLGLWISKKIVELHGGVIGAHSAGEGTGCTFFFQMPLENPKNFMSSVEEDEHDDIFSSSVQQKGRRNSTIGNAWELMVNSVSPRSSVMMSKKYQTANPNGLDIEQGSVASDDRKGSIASEEKKKKKKTKLKNEQKVNEIYNIKYMGNKKWDDGLNMLLVDDSALNRKMMCRLLSGAGHQVSDLSDGLEFVQLIESELERINVEGNGSQVLPGYDIVLMDDSMPGLSGPDTARKARELGFVGLIVGVTGNAFSDQINHYLASGANAVLQKPLDLKVLKEKLEQLMQN